MKVLGAILRREWLAILNSTQAGITGALFLLLAGALGVFNLNSYLQASAMLMLRSQGQGREPVVLDWGEHLLRQDLGALALLALIYLPLLAMNLLAEERRGGTLELLMTSPVGDGRLVLGKWLAAQLHFLLLIVLALLPKLLFLRYGSIDGAGLLVGLAGIALMGGAFLALALLVGSLTRSPLVAAGGGFALLFLLWMLGSYARPGAGGFPGGLLQSLSAMGHLAPLLAGLVDSADLAYFAVIILLGLELSRRSLQALRGGGR